MILWKYQRWVNKEDHSVLCQKILGGKLPLGETRETNDTGGDETRLAHVRTELLPTGADASSMFPTHSKKIHTESVSNNTDRPQVFFGSIKKNISALMSMAL